MQILVQEILRMRELGQRITLATVKESLGCDYPTAHRAIVTAQLATCNTCAHAEPRGGQGTLTCLANYHSQHRTTGTTAACSSYIPRHRHEIH